ncbi:MAG: histidine kinase dimerization/phospho-acceptor domain-containing protein [Gaiellaceae bacterium]
MQPRTRPPNEIGSQALPDTLPKLVALACHDLRTPLATVRGLARTLEVRGGLEESTAGWLRLVEEASVEMAELIDQLSLAARIETGEYDPVRHPVATEALARQALSRFGETIELSGEGAVVLAEEKVMVRAIAALARCLLRHGGLERARLELRGTSLVFTPVDAETAPVLLGMELRDLQAAIAVRLVDALGGDTAYEQGELRVRLPAASA